MPLAEGPDLGGEFLVIVLVGFLIVLVVWCAAVAAGYRAAPGAARGSVRDRVTLVLAMFVELVPGLVGGPNPLLVLGLIAVGVQLSLFARARGG